MHRREEKPRRLRPSELRTLLMESPWQEDGEVTRLTHDRALTDGHRVIVLSGNAGALHTNRETLVKKLREMLDQGPWHMLSKNWNAGGDFETRVPELLKYLAGVVGMNVSWSFSGAEASELTTRLNAARSRLPLAETMPCIVAYVGEAIRRRVPGANWDVVRAAIRGPVWEPWLVTEQGSRFAPFVTVMDDAHEDNPWDLVSVIHFGSAKLS